MKKELTCIICPKGCKITVDYEENNILNIVGHTCKRGFAYASDEAINPKRTVTTTVRTENGDVISVKTDKPIQKKLMFDCMNVINDTKISLPVRVGDILISNICDTDVNIVATQNKD